MCYKLESTTFYIEYANLSKLPDLSGSFIPLLSQQVFLERLIYESFCASPQAYLFLHL